MMGNVPTIESGVVFFYTFKEIVKQIDKEKLTTTQKTAVPELKIYNTFNKK